MGFKNLKPNVAQTMAESLTPAQEDEICDLFSQGYSASGIKHAICNSFDPGTKFKHLIAPAIAKMIGVEGELLTIVYGSPEIKAQDAADELGLLHPEYDKPVLKHLVDTIADATGTWSEYVDAVQTLDLAVV